MKNTSCSQVRSSFGMFWVILLSFLVLSLPVQSCRLNQNVLAQAASINQIRETGVKSLSLKNDVNLKDLIPSVSVLCFWQINYFREK